MSRRKTPPNDPEARNRTKRKTNWTGYAVHLAETCDADGPEIFTHVDTTPATTADVEITDTIHQALAMTGRVTMFGISRWTGASSQFARGERKVAVPTVVQGETARYLLVRPPGQIQLASTKLA